MRSSQFIAKFSKYVATSALLVNEKVFEMIDVKGTFHSLGARSVNEPRPKEYQNLIMKPYLYKDRMHSMKIARLVAHH